MRDTAVCTVVLQDFVDGIVANWFIPYMWSRFGAWSTTYRYSAAKQQQNRDSSSSSRTGTAAAGVTAGISNCFSNSHSSNIGDGSEHSSVYNIMHHSG
jgi:hypothetical protein